jgi:hypothetical protein
MAAGEASSLAAFIAAGGALAVAVLGWLGSRSNQAKLLEHQSELQRYQRDLKRLEAELAEKKAERDARRDYEYEARKRLYHECSPLLFQLADQAASALSRIQGLAASAAQGNLQPGPTSWLTSTRDRYYRTSTEYRLLSPCATLKLLQQRLTKLDLSLDTDFHLTYVLARQAARSLGDDFDIAALGSKALEYDPHSNKAETLTSKRADIYWQQGVPRGILENAVEALLVKEADGTSRVMTFLEFEQHLTREEDSIIKSAIGRIRYLFADFHPKERPILWRLLLVNACIYRVLQILADRDHAQTQYPDLKKLLRMPVAERKLFDWRSDRNNESEAAAIDEPFAAVDAYLEQKIDQELVRIVRSASNQQP